MIEQFIGLAEALIVNYGILGVFLAAVTEEIIAPIPSGLVMMSAGYAFLAGSPLTFTNFIYLVATVAIPLSIGLTIGSLFVYGLSYAYGETLIKRYGRYIGLTWPEVMKLHAKFDKSHRDEITLLVLRLLPIIPSIAINAVAGLVKFNPRPYILITILGTLLRATLVSFIGWQAGNVYKEYATQIDHYENYVLYALAVLFISFILYKKYGIPGKKKEML